MVAKAPILDPRRRAFAEEYLKTSNAYQSALKAGYTEQYAKVHSFEIPMQEPVRLYMEHRRKQMLKGVITPERVLLELASIGFADIDDFAEILQGNVLIKDTATLTANKRAAIVGIKEGRNGIEVKLADKLKALELIGRNLGVFDGDDKKQPDTSLMSALLDVVKGGG